MTETNGSNSKIGIWIFGHWILFVICFLWFVICFWWFIQVRCLNSVPRMHFKRLTRINRKNKSQITSTKLQTISNDQKSKPAQRPAGKIPHKVSVIGPPEADWIWNLFEIWCLRFVFLPFTIQFPQPLKYHPIRYAMVLNFKTPWHFSCWLVDSPFCNI